MEETAHTLDHPFGQEDKVSAVQLFFSFCNNLKLGQWELARACAILLHKTQIQNPSHSSVPSIVSILKAVSYHPHGISFGSIVLPCPIHLVWRSLQLLRELSEDNPEIVLPKEYEKQVEFLLLLFKASSKCSPTVVQELLTFLDHIQTAQNNSASVKNMPPLSRQALNFLRITLLQDPCLGQTIIHFLEVPNSPSFQTSNQSLQKLYSICITDTLSSMKREIANGAQNPQSLESLQQVLANLFVNFKPTRKMVEIQPEKIFIDLLEVDSKCNDLNLLQSVMGSLLGHEDSYLVNCLISVRSKRIFKELELNVLEKTLQTNYIPREAVLLLSLAEIGNRPKAWSFYFEIVLTEKRHLLGSVITSALALAQEGMYEELSLLLSPCEFHYLKPLILLIGWKYVNSPLAAEGFIRALWTEEMVKGEPLLLDACSKLVKQVHQMQWCLNCIRNLLPSPQHQILLESRANKMFRDLSSHSVLHMVYQLTNVSLLSSKDVVGLLKQTPVCDPVQNRIPSKQKRVKSVHFAEEQVDHSSLSIEQSRDVAIHSSFLIIKDFTEAVCAVASCDKHRSEEVPYSVITDYKQLTDQHSVHPKTLDEFVERKLKSVESKMSRLYPLTYRVEVLENLFSLLFARHEDWAWLLRGAIDSADDEEGFTEEDWINKSVTSIESIENTIREHVSKEEALSGADLKRQQEASLVQEIYTKENSCKNSQLEIPCTRNDVDQLQHSSENSQHSTVGNIHIGFLAADFIIKNLIDNLRSCLESLAQDKFSLYGPSSHETTPHEKDTLASYMSTSVPLTQLAARISRLTQYINEAWWRYQLVAEDPQVKVQDGHQEYWSSEEDLEKFTQIISDDAHGIQRNQRKRKKSRSRSGSGLSSGKESGSYSATSQHSYSTDGSTGRGRRHRRRRKRRSDSSHLAPPKDRGVIARMLSTHETLLSMCLKKGNYAQAGQVVHMFGLESKPEVNEVEFSQKWQEAVNMLKTIESQSKLNKYPTKMTPSHPAGQLGASISAIANMAAAGMASTSVTGIVDNLLAKTNLPSAPDVSELSPKGEHSPIMYTAVDHIKSLNIPSMIILDLACCFCKSWRSFRDLIKNAVGRQQNFDSFKKTPSPRSVFYVRDSRFLNLKGIDAFLSQMYQLSNMPPSQTKVAYSPEMKQKYFELPIGSFLTESGKSLDATSYESSVWRNVELKTAMSDLLDACQNSTTTENGLVCATQEMILNASSSVSTKRKIKFRRDLAIKPKSPSHLEEQDLGVNQAARKLLRLLDKRIPQPTNENAREDHEDTNQFGNYFFSLFHHATILSSLQLEAADWNPVNDKELEGGGYSSSNPFSIFKESPSRLLGQMMFLNQIPPFRLEQVASRLKLDLVQITIESCCPVIPVSPSKTLTSVDHRITQSKKQQPFSAVSSGVIVLNECLPVPDSETKTARLPGTTAFDLLTRMITLMKSQLQGSSGNEMFDVNAAAHVACHPEYHSIQIACQELAMVDLNLLYSNGERICFFTNVLNLLLVHAALHHIHVQIMAKMKKNTFVPSHTRHRSLTSPPMPSVEGIIPHSGSSSPTLSMLTYLNKYAYRIGQMGIVSAFDLEFIVLRKGLPAPAVFGHTLTDRLTELSPAHPWYRFVPEPDTRLVFVISNGCVSSPSLDILREDDLDEQLDLKMQQYLEYNLDVNESKHEVIFPQLLEWFRKDFTGGRLSSTGSQGDIYAGLLNVIVPHVSQRLAGKLEVYSLRFSPGKVDVEPVSGGSESSDDSTVKRHTILRQQSVSLKIKTELFSYNFGFCFKYSAAPRHLSLKRRLSSPDRMEQTTSETTLSSKSLFRMTKSTLEYLESKSDLFAKLAGITSEAVDDAVFSSRSAITSDFNSSLSTSVGSPKSLEFVDEAFGSDRVFKEEAFSPSVLSKVLVSSEHYPSLQRYIKSFFSEILTVTLDPIESSISSSLSSNDPLTISNARACVLVNQTSSDFQNLVCHALEKQILNHNWDGAIKLLDSLSGYEGYFKGDFPILRDFVLCCAAKDVERTKSGERMLKWRHLLGISNVGLQLNMILNLLGKLPSDACLKLLEVALSRCQGDEKRCESLLEKLEEMKIYQQIEDYSRTYHPSVVITSPDQQEGAEYEEDTPLQDWSMTWQQVAGRSIEEPDRMFDIIISSGDFQLARKWADLHGLVDQYQMDIQRKQLEHLLKDSSNTVHACQILEGLEDREEAMNLCHLLLDSRDICLPSVVFLVQYITTKFPDMVTSDMSEELQALSIGAKALMCLPERAKDDYFHLKKIPHLILEQLLMNVKVDWAKRVYLVLLQEIEQAVVTIPSLAGSSLKKMIQHYAKEAMDIPQVQLTALGDSFEWLFNISDEWVLDFEIGASPLTRSMTSTSLMSLSAILSPNTKSRGRFSTGVAPSSIPVPRSNVEKASSPPSSSSNPKSPQSTKISPRISAGSYERSVIVSQDGKEKEFVLPVTPPKKEDWVPDGSVTHCMICKEEKFSMLNRRHHCRRCGRVVCWRCSQLKALVQGYGDAPVRVCNECYNMFIMPRNQGGRLNSTPVSFEKRQNLLQGSAVSSGRGTPHSGSVTPTSDQNQSLTLQLLPEVEWRLSTNSEENVKIREEFYYEKAPSTSLCLSILEIHEDPLECGRKLLEFVEKLSENLCPIHPGMTNPEVDYNLVISMMRNLLLNAKLKFVLAEDSTKVEQCDSYLTRVDLLKLFVAENTNDIPSIQQLNQTDKARQVRDRLVMAERLSLAMEVSTKCGLDPSAVWSAWGSSCLRAGDYTTARSKFARVLKPVHDKNSVVPPSKLLCDIIDYLESSVAQSIKAQDILKTSSPSIKEFMAMPQMRGNAGINLETAPLKECVHYIEAYGSHLTAVQFYMRHRRLSVALDYISSNKCSGEIFLEGMFLPCLKRGEVPKLEQHLSELDPDLQRWNPYLTAVCQYLNKHKLNHILYKMQLFMKDFVRAAMTCIKFFQTGAKTYTDLHDQLHYVHYAKDHLQTMLDRKEWTSVTQGNTGWGGGGRNADTSPRMNLSPSELTKHMNTITIQIEVTKFLHRAHSGKASPIRKDFTQFTSSQGGSPKLPTLFGNSKEKAEVAHRILLSGSSIQEGFSLAFRIIQDFRLPDTLIYSRAGRFLASIGKRKDIENLIGCIKGSGLSSDESCDEVLMSCIRVMADNPNMVKDAENLVKIIKTEGNKINALISCGKLRNAYLLAVKGEREDDVQRIASAAERVGQSQVKGFCDKWLAAQAKKRQHQEQTMDLLFNKKGQNKWN